MEQGIVRPIPPTYKNGQAWTSKLIKGMSSEEIRRLIALYGLTQINNQIAANIQRGVK